MTDSFTNRLQEHFLAGSPAIYIQSAEESRVDQLLEDLKRATGLKRTHEWNLGHGWVNPENKHPVGSLDVTRTELEHALLSLLDADLEQSLIVIKGARQALEHNNLAIARLKQLLNRIERHHSGECSVILIAEAVFIPAPLEAQITLLPLPLPDREEIKQLLANAQDSGQLQIPESLSDLAISGLSGLTASEIGHLLKMVARKHPTLSSEALKVILREKEQIIAKSGVLEMVHVDAELGDIGGLEQLKVWLQQRSNIIRRWDEACARGVKPPKGILIAGMPGCGKSLTAKVAASLFQLPLLRLDIGSLLGKYVGESEHNMRRALSMAETVSPCILWIDELEKAFVGMGGGNASEVTSRLLGFFLTWMQEKTGTVFVIATANDISALPPELLRKGRFDEIFYVGFPNTVEREQILKIHLAKSNQPLPDLDLQKLVQLCLDYSGADIENAVNEALTNAFIADEPLSQKWLESAIQATIPLRETLRDQVGKYEELFEKLKLRPASNYQGLSVAQMIKMAADPNQIKREEVARHPECPQDQLEKLANDTQHSVIKAVYQNPRCPEHLLSKRINIGKQAAQFDAELLELACLNGNAPEDLIKRQIAECHISRELQFKIAAQTKGPLLLQELANDTEYAMRRKVASNPLAPENVQLQLAQDKDADVRRDLASNPALTESVQLQLIADRNPTVVSALVRNQALNHAARSRLKNEHNSQVKEAFAKRSDVTDEEQLRLLENAELGLAVALASHPSPSLAVQLKLATDKDVNIRILLAENPNLAKETQEILAEDDCNDVKVALAVNPGLLLDNKKKNELKKLAIELRHMIEVAPSTSGSVSTSSWFGRK